MKSSFFFFQAEDGIRDYKVTGVQTCALPIYMSLIRVGMALDSHHHQSWPMRVARQVVNFPAIHLEERGNELNEPVRHLLQLRRVPPESHRGEENCYITPDNCFGDLAAGIRFHTHARCLDPAIKATETVGQFHFAQTKGLDLSAVCFEHVRQHVKNWRQVRRSEERRVGKECRSRWS